MESKWWLFEEIDGITPFFADLILGSVTSVMRGSIGACYGSGLCAFDGEFCKVYLPRADLSPVGTAALGKLRGRKFFLDFRKKLIAESDGLEEWSKTRLERDWKDASNRDLSDTLLEYRERMRRLYVYAFVPNSIDLVNGNFQNPLVRELEDFLKAKNPGKAAYYLSVLTTPTEQTSQSKESLEFFKLAKLVKGAGRLSGLFSSLQPAELDIRLASDFPEISREINQHAKTWGWISHAFIGPAKFNREYYLQLLSSVVRSGEDVDGEIRKLELASGKTSSEQESIARELGLSEEKKYLFRLASQLVFLKAYRKDAAVHSYYSLRFLLVEAARRLNLSLKQIRFLMVDEIVTALVSNAEVGEICSARMRNCVLLTMPEGSLVLTGSKAQEQLESIIEERIAFEQELKGQCACPGYAKGPAAIINKAEEMGKLEDGGILVSAMTNPELVTAMKRAGAIVTDMGGLTCHAAIVSRELRIPCVVGTRIATKAFKDGDVVEVDATHGTAKKV